jgi:heme exporter protein A
MGLKGFEESQCFSLSAGQQQRVSLSKLPLIQSKVWVLDEPFTTLDVEGIKLLENLLCEHADRGGLALVTTHHQLAIPGITILDLG